MSKIENYNIGAFVLHIGGTINASYNVISFQLTKQIGKYATCIITVADYTDNVVGPSTKFPSLGSIKDLFKKSVQSQANGELADCSLIEYRTQGSNRTWFTGKLCVVTPLLQTAMGVQAGLQCSCAGKACQLQYCPASDYIYTPSNIANNVQMLQASGFFSSDGINDAMFAASWKPSVEQIIGQSGTTIDNSILQMLDKNLTTLLSFQGKRGQQLAQLQPDIRLSDYFTCDIYPSAILKMQNYHTMHAYMKGLVEDFINGYMGNTILNAVVEALYGQSRFLTFVPPAMGEPDKLKIWPSFIQRLNSSITLQPADMTRCSVVSNPLQHIRTPTYIYIRSKMLPAYETKGDTYSRTFGKYVLQGAKAPYRLKLLDVPSWVLNVIVQSQQIKNAQGTSVSGEKPATMLVNRDADAVQGGSSTAGASKTYTTETRSWDLKSVGNLLNAYAKTVYFHTYMMDKQANMDLAVTQKTLGLDKYIGQSLKFIMPVEASQLGGSGETFYGRLQSLSYTFQGATSPKAKSVLRVTCGFSGVAPQNSPGSSLYKDDNQTFIYRIGKK